jgi:isoquinoline 1-oxidoreductase beta subunit
MITQGRDLTRRALLKAAGGLMVAVQMPGRGWAQTLVAPEQTASAEEAALNDELGPFLHIPRKGPVVIVDPTTEMGQGTYTAHAQIVAEELGIDFDQLQVIAAPPAEDRYRNPMLHYQVTGSSVGIRAFYMPLRRAGASARYRLLHAAAQRWNVDVKSCVTRRGTVVHEPSGRSATFGDLADAAAKIPAPTADHLELTPSHSFRLIGKSLGRIDSPDKADGKALFGIDIVRPGMKIAIMTSCPYIGGTLASVDPAPAMAVKGVYKVLTLTDALVVVADTTWAAMKGVQALRPDWQGGNPNINNESLMKDIGDAAISGTPIFTKRMGSPEDVFNDGHHKVDLILEVPFLAHATLEPLNAVAHVTPDGCEIWAGTQGPVRAQDMVLKMTGIPREKIKIHNQYIGGGFGRKAEADYIGYAALISKLSACPIKMIWTREQDFRAGYFRPAFRNHVQASLDSQNRITSWSHRIVGGDVFARFLPVDSAKGLPDEDAIEGSTEIPYSVMALKVEYVRHDPPFPVTWWRSVGPGHNVFVIETVMDVLAEKAGIDPIEFRRSLLRENPRQLRVLDLVAEKSGWDASLPPRRGRGVALQRAFGSYIACVIEVEVSHEGDIRVHRVTAVADCGQMINPNQVRGQLEGGFIFGLTAALWGKVEVANGQIITSNFNNYRMMRLNETPPMDIHLVQSDAAPEGVGEAGTAIIFPAITNAVHAATGVRVLTLPLDRHELLREKSGWSAHKTAVGAGLVALGVGGAVAAGVAAHHSKKTKGGEGERA